MKLNVTLFIIIILSTFYITCSGQKNATWNKWNWLIGNWKGEGNGQPGQGGGNFSFKPDLDKNILLRESHSEYPATDNKSKKIHDDLMIIYLDSTKNPSKAIYFDNEGHVINYSISYSNQSIIFISNKIQNIPVFRLTYTQLDEETVNTKFELSQNGGKFINYIEGKSKKIK